MSAAFTPKLVRDGEQSYADERRYELREARKRPEETVVTVTGAC